MRDFKLMCRCDLCGSEFQMGRHVYAGKVIPTYEITVCMGCYQANHDGWGPALEERVIAKLREKGLPIPQRNERGWLPRD